MFECSTHREQHLLLGVVAIVQQRRLCREGTQSYELVLYYLVWGPTLLQRQVEVVRVRVAGVA